MGVGGCLKWSHSMFEASTMLDSMLFTDLNNYNFSQKCCPAPISYLYIKIISKSETKLATEAKK